MIVKTSDLIGKPLNWAVAKFETLLGHRHGFRLQDKTPYWRLHSNEEPCYASTSWAQGGPIAEREKISVASPSPIDESWTAYAWLAKDKQNGPTELIAKMRCYIAMNAGESVDIPDELFL